MEQHGVLRSWNDNKGFGFIHADNSDYFVHISSVRGADRPQQGETVFFVADKDEKGRLRAQHVRTSMERSAVQRKPATSPHTNIPAHRQRLRSSGNLKRALSLLIVAGAIPAIGTWYAFTQHAVLWPLLLYVAMSLFSVLQYWCDKHNAQIGQWRIPEKQLHAVELLGGWPGALLAQQLLRHKTQKTSFQVVFWLIILAHQVYWLDQLGFAGQFLQQVLSAV